MAASFAMQSILARPLNRVVSNRSTNRVNQFLIPTSYVPHLPRYANMRVRSMAEVIKSLVCFSFYGNLKSLLELYNHDQLIDF